MSINVGPLKDGSHQCDLNDVTDDKEFAVALTKTTGYTYNGVEVRALMTLNLMKGHHACKNVRTFWFGRLIFGHLLSHFGQ